MNKIFGVTVGTTKKPLDAANALKGTASGSAVTMTDVSPLEHNIGVKLNYNKLSPNSSIETLLQICEAGSASLTFDGEKTSGRYVVQSKGEDYILFDGGKLNDFASPDVINKINIGDVIQITIDEEDELIWDVYLVKADLSSVTLKKYGKNLLDQEILAKGVGTQESCKKEADGSFTLEKTGQDKRWTAYSNILDIPSNTPFAISFKVNSTSVSSIGIHFKHTNGTDTYVGWRFNTPYTGKLEKDIEKIRFYILPESAIGSYINFSDVQFEIGTATEYEPYKEPIPCPKPNADGTVQGIIGNGESMTLQTDTDGVTITAEYNRDINKAFAELQQAIIMMGGAL